MTFQIINLMENLFGFFIHIVLQWLLQNHAYNTITVDSYPWEQSLWGQHGAYLGLTGPRWSQFWHHEPCYLRSFGKKCSFLLVNNCIIAKQCFFYHNVLNDHGISNFYVACHTTSEWVQMPMKSPKFVVPYKYFDDAGMEASTYNMPISYVKWGQLYHWPGNYFTTKGCFDIRRMTKDVRVQLNICILHIICIAYTR